MLSIRPLPAYQSERHEFWVLCVRAPTLRERPQGGARSWLAANAASFFAALYGLHVFDKTVVMNARGWVKRTPPRAVRTSLAILELADKARRTCT